MFARFAQERAEMVRLLRQRGIRDERVLKALGTVPREVFVPEEMKTHAYGDHPLPIAAHQTISQPYIVSLMTEALELESEHKVLEIGTGSGYQTAILAEVDDSIKIYTVERIHSLFTTASTRLADLGYDKNKIVFLVGDGSLGWEENSPYDRIICTAGAKSIPLPLINQLKVGGLLIIPAHTPHSTGEDCQELLRICKTQPSSNGTTNFTTETICSVRFVPLVKDPAP
jgi:protein-L-isoaspartate(D-aspartate) O-methyltransferase